MIKILFIVDYLTMNTGGPRFLIDVFRRLSMSDYKIHIITGAIDYTALYILKSRSNVDIINLNIFNTKALPSEQPINVIKFLHKAFNIVNSITKRSHIDIIHLNSHFPNLLSYAIKLNVPIICSIHHLEETIQFLSLIHI